MPRSPTNPGRRAFETDALTAYRRLPLAVALPRSTEEVARVMRFCRDERVNVVPRGAGTSLSGGAIPQEDASSSALTKMSRILEVNLADRYARVEAGVTNLAISEAAGAEGFFYAPDPSSQLACTIGGNIGDELGRRALPQIRRHHQQPARRPARHASTARSSTSAARRWTRPASTARARVRLGGPARHRDGGDGAPHPAAGRGAAGAVRLRFGRGREPVRRRDHRRRHRAGGDGISGQARDRTSARISPTPAIRSTSRRC